MAALASLTCAGAATFAAPGTDPNAPARLSDLKFYTSVKPASKTAAGVTGQYHCDGDFRYDCYAPNQWARSPVVSDWTP